MFHLKDLYINSEILASPSRKSQMYRFDNLRRLTHYKRNQLEYMLKKWKFRRNINKSTWVHIDQCFSKRKREGKESEVILCGKRLKRETVAKETDRYRDNSIFAQLQLQRVSPPVIPADTKVVVCTPPPFSMELEWPSTLPWLRFPAEELKVMLSTYRSKNLERHNNLLAVLWQPQEQIMQTHFSQFAVSIERIMPESYPQENLHRTQRLLGGSREEQIYEELSMVIYQMSNNILNPRKERVWNRTIRALETSGLSKISFNLENLNSWTIDGFMEKLFYAAIHRMHKVTKDERETMEILKWLFTLGQSPAIPHRIFWHYRGIHWTPRLEQRNLRLMECLLEAGADANSVSLCYDYISSSVSDDDSYDSNDINDHDSDDDDSDNDRNNNCNNDNRNYTNDRSKSIPRTILEIILNSKRSNDVVVAIAKLLFKHGASVNLDQALISAVRRRSQDLIEMILENGGNPCAEFECSSGFVYKETALSAAAALGLSETQYILNLLASRNKSNPITELITADVLISAASTGQNDTIRFLHDQSSSNIAANSLDITPLHAAAYHGHLSTCQLLVPLQGGHVPDFMSMYSPLHFACYNCHQDVIQFLISQGSDVNAIARTGRTARELRAATRVLPNHKAYIIPTHARPLSMVFDVGLVATGSSIDFEKRASCAIMLINAGARPGLHELDIAISKLHFDLLLTVLPFGVDPNGKIDTGSSVPQRALLKAPDGPNPSHYDIIAWLLASGAKLLGGGVVSAIRHGDWDLVDLILYYDGTLSETDKFGTTVLEAAIQSQHASGLARLFEMMPGIYDAGALCASIATEQTTIADQLIANRGNKPIDHELEVTAIGLAAESGNLGLLRSLLKHPPTCKFGPMPLTPERSRWKHLEYNRTDISLYCVGSPLALVARKNLDEVIEVCSELFKYGFQPDRLTWAVATDSNNIAFAQYLLSQNQVYKDNYEYGPDQSKIPSPLGWAIIAHNNKEFVTLLLRAGAEVNEERTSPLQLAAAVGDLGMVRCLVDAGANVNRPPAFKDGGTALQSAALHGHLVVAKYLLDHGAEVNAMPSCYDGRSALEAAAEHGRLDMLELLLANGAHKRGDCHRLYIRAVTRATMRGHHTAANLLKQSLGWSEQDEKMALTKDILGEH